MFAGVEKGGLTISSKGGDIDDDYLLELDSYR